MKKLSVILVAMLVALTFSSCKRGGMPTKVYVVYAHRANSSAKPDMDLLDKYLDSIAHNTGKLSVVSVESEPRFVDALAIDDASYASSSQGENIMSQVYTQVALTLDSTKAITPEADVLKSLHLVASAASGSTNNKLIVADSMITTTGILNLSAEISSSNDVSAIVEQLVKVKAIPDLSPFDEICVSGLGEVTMPQEELSYSQKDWLKNLWIAIFDVASPGVDVKFVNQPLIDNNEESKDLLPKVTPVTVIEDIIVFSDIVLDETLVKFKPDSAMFLDEASARATISSYVNDINKSNGVYIAGSTAKLNGQEGNSKRDYELSFERANAVTSILVEEGANPSKIKPIGLGYNHCFRVADNESSNRCVLIFDQSGDSAKVLEDYISNGGEFVSDIYHG